MLHIIGPLWRECTSGWRFPSQRASKQKVFPCHNIIMPSPTPSYSSDRLVLGSTRSAIMHVCKWSVHIWGWTHSGWVRHISVNEIIIGSDNCLLPGQCQAIIWTNSGTLLIGPWGINFSEILIEINPFSFKKNTFENVVCIMTSISSWPQWVELYIYQWAFVIFYATKLPWQHAKWKFP